MGFDNSDLAGGYPVYNDISVETPKLRLSNYYSYIVEPVTITFDKNDNSSSYYKLQRYNNINIKYAADSFTFDVVGAPAINNKYRVYVSTDNSTWDARYVAETPLLYYHVPTISQSWNVSTHAYPFTASHQHSGASYAYGYYKHEIYYYADSPSNEVLVDVQYSTSQSETFTFTPTLTGYYDYKLYYSYDGVTYYLYDEGLQILEITGFTGSGSGTSGSPYLITTAEQLQSMRFNLDKYFKLSNDIELGEYPTDTYPNFTSVGSEGTAFTGGFDGNQKYIYNMTTTSSGGLFGTVYIVAPFTRDAIHDFIMVDPKVTSSGSQKAIVVNVISYSSDPGNTTWNTYSGLRRVGIVGGYINDTSGSYIAPLFAGASGYYDGMYVHSNLMAARDCFSTAEIIAADGGAYISGIGMGNIIQIRDVYNAGEMFGGTDQSYYSGGFAIRDAGVIATSSSLAHFTETDTYFDLTETGQLHGYDGTYGYTHAQMKTLSNFATWDLATTWKASGAGSVLEGMPVFQWSTKYDDVSPTPTPTWTGTPVPTTVVPTGTPTPTLTPTLTGTPAPASNASVRWTDLDGVTITSAYTGKDVKFYFNTGVAGINPPPWQMDNYLIYLYKKNIQTGEWVLCDEVGHDAPDFNIVYGNTLYPVDPHSQTAVFFGVAVQGWGQINFTKPTDYRAYLVAFNHTVYPPYQYVYAYADIAITDNPYLMNNLGGWAQSVGGDGLRYLIAVIIIIILVCLPFLIFRMLNLYIEMFMLVLGLGISSALGLIDLVVLMGLMIGIGAIFVLIWRSGGGNQ
jgi:hypothetical protein